MATATITIPGLKKEKLQTLRRQAKSLGLSEEKYAQKLIEDGISLEHRARTRTFDQMLAPVRDEFRKSGMSEDELEDLLSKARAHHRGRRTQKRR